MGSTSAARIKPDWSRGEDDGRLLFRPGSGGEGRRGKADGQDSPNPEGAPGMGHDGVVLCLFVTAPEDMPKLKSRKAAAKRFKATGSGKFMRRRAFRSHLLDHKSPKRKRYLGTMAVVDERDADNVSAMLPYA
jgi:large subunit ribosomal protein L35